MRRVFESVKIGNLELKNRLVRSATWEGIAQPDGSMTEVYAGEVSVRGIYGYV